MYKHAQDFIKHATFYKVTANTANVHDFAALK